MSAGNNSPDQLITTNEAAQYMRCTRAFLWKMRKEGKLQSLSAGKKVLFERSAIESFLNKKTPGKNDY